ncbi:DUF2231 domain-containing protein [Methylomicrobium lacus]|uniref:DUF2231 domain-containing protein n=1 Tax=Methylomicrobium lacus TaxID=136992 RepID=UPI0035A931CF
MGSVLYDLLALVGYSHPVHPVLVHVPAGMSIGAFCFALLAFLTKQQAYRNTAYQITVLAFVFIFLAIPVGFMDWQRFYGGAWIFEIKMKLALATLYFLLMLTAVVIGRRHHDSPAMLALYFSGMLTVGGLGFFGGQLVYRGFAPEAPAQFKIGRHTFESHCSGCHRRGENIIVPSLPLRNAPQLQNFNDFLNFIRDPKMPDGSPGSMPRFTLDKLSDQEAKQLYDYLYFEFLAQKRPSY